MNPYFQRYNGCGPCRPWCYDTSQNSTAFSSCSRNRGFSRGAAIDHVLPANKTTGSLSRSSSTMKMTSLNTSPGFFLRPHLTREEYAYWNSRFRLRSSSCALPCACASNPRDNTTVTYQHREPSVCARNATGFPSYGRKPPCGNPPVRSSSTSEGFCKNSGCVPKPCDPPKNASSTNSGIRRTKANAIGCHYPTNTSPNLKGASESIFRDKRFVETTCPARSGRMESKLPQ
ncbi:hypothetical protein OS493_022905 [Desmophyllum pertusum]|uniref:Uncharacterized protein n=1 Tax=Desmophyllum pertusum TaxID=174260 RepID=A0A9W9ZM76_9CNID|nr:hypothetical protein OS493_022905 [Desmophyllum pertusum]